MTTTTATTAATLAEHADALRRAAALPGLLVHVHPEIQGGAVSYGPDRCSPVPGVVLSPSLLTGEDLALVGTLAHEVAHHALRHHRRTLTMVLLGALRTAQVAGLVALVMDVVPVALLAAILAVGVRLVDDMVCRGEEYAADAHAVALLTQIGLPGRRAVLAMLATIAYPWWFGWGGGRLRQHPPTPARVQHITRYGS